VLKVNIVFLVALTFLLLSCASLSSRPSLGLHGELVVFAASSLTEAFYDIKEGFESNHPRASITYNFAGTQTLRMQLEHHAQADVFASADDIQMSLAVDSGVTQGEPVSFATNRLVVIAPRGSFTVQTLKDLAGSDAKLVLGLPDVPVGTYSRLSLQHMGESGEFGADFYEHVTSTVVSEEINVLQVLVKVVLNEADAGIVYWTDGFRAAEKIRLITIPDRFNVLANYPVAVVKGTRKPILAEAFVKFLRSPEGQIILISHGFAPANSP
jgi:molybdate transport system substrate-binding protein